MSDCTCEEVYHDEDGRCPRHDLDPAVKTEPFPHQREVYLAHRDKRCFALFWEMGLGKSKTVIDVASHLHMTDKIDALLIVAPNSVYANWILHEIPAHMATSHYAYRFRTGEKRQEHRVKRAMIVDPRTDALSGRLRVIAMSYDALRTEHGAEFALRVVMLHRTMIVADESTAIKSGKAQRSKRVKEIAQHCHYRWIATGTPVAQSPFDIHSQIELLDPLHWKRYGIRSYAAFKGEFGVYQTQRFGNKSFAKRVAFRGLERLQAMIAPISSRLLKEDSSVELPPKLYSLRYFELAPRQRQLYDQLRRELEAEISREPEAFVEAPLAITRMTRLQQICSGFVTAVTSLTVGGLEALKTGDDDDRQVYMDYLMENGATLDEAERLLVRPVVERSEIVEVVPDDENPRLQALLEVLEECSHKVIVWCRFVREVDIICRALRDDCVRYDGRVSSGDREIALRRFTDPDGPRVFVANTHAISMGVTLNVAKTAVYFSNSYSLEKRLQSEDRFHRIGQTQSVSIIDLVAEHTLDEKIVESLRAKFDVAAQVTGDRLREWITLPLRED